MTTSGLGGTGPLDDATTRELKVAVPAGGSASAWWFRVDGDVQPVNGGDASVETDGVYSEQLRENGDGTVTIAGSSTGHTADAFRYDGPIVDGDVDSQIEIYRDGRPTSLSAVVMDSTLRVVAGSELESYSVTVSGDAARAPEAESAPQDTITPNGDGTTTISGAAGNGFADAYRFAGEVVSADVPEAFTVYVDGTEWSPRRRLVVRADESVPLRPYEITVDGGASMTDRNEGVDAVATGDGTATLSGKVGNGGVDAFDVGGDVRYGRVPDGLSVTLDDEPRTVRRRLAVTADSGVSGASYEITVEGDAWAVGSAGTVTDGGDDTVAVSGTVADGATAAFEVEGEVLYGQVPDGVSVELDGDAVTVQHRLRIEADANVPLRPYEITVEGGALSTDANEEGQDAVTAGDGTATLTGKVGNGAADAFGVEGDVLYGRVPDGVSVTLDGEPRTVRRELEILGDPDVSTASYEVTIQGDAWTTAPNEPWEESITDNGDGTVTVSGKLGGGGGDRFAFEGEVLYDDVPDGLTMRVDGEAVDPSRTLRVVAGDALAAYELVIDGRAFRAPEAEPAPQDVIAPNGDGTTTITGQAGNGYADAYYVTGDVLYGNVGDEQTVYVDGTEITLSRHLAVEAASKLSPSSYEITLEGDAEPLTEGAGVAEAGDSVTRHSDGTVTVSGVVGNGKVDSFYVTGRPIAADHPADIRTYVEGEEIDLVRGTDLFSDRVDRVVSVVEAGADPTGSDPVDPVFGSEMDGSGNVGFYFPPYVDGQRATYLIEDFAPTADNIELRSRDPGAVLVPSRRDYSSSMFEMRGNHAVIDGFVYDVTDAGFAPKIDVFADNWQISRFVVHGRADVSDYPEAMEAEDNGVSLFRLAVTDPDGVGTLEDVYMADGGALPGERGNRRAVFVMANSAAYHLGRIEARRCWFENWVENTWYGVYGNGTCLIEDCYVRNSPIGLRSAGGSAYRNCTFVKDGQVPWQRASLWGNADPGSNRTRGIWLNGGDDANPYQPIEIADCDFVFTDDTDFTMGQPIVATHPTATTRIANTRIHLEQRTTDDGYSADRHDRWPAFKLDDYASSSAPSPAEFAFEGLHVTSDSQDAPAIVFDHEADVTAFDVEVDCPAGATNLAKSDVEATWNVGTDPVAADASPPIPEPPSYRIPTRSRR